MFTPRSLMASGMLMLTALTAAARAETALTYADLVQRMTDLSQLAVLPQAGEKCGLWSSYDRASRYDEKTGKYVNWDANGDGNGVIRTEGDQVVMAEMKGPGCIWRIWSAAAEKGHVKIYLDDQPEPAVDLPFADYFDGKHAPFNYPELSYNLNTHRFQRPEPLPADSLSEVVQGSGRQRLGQLLPFQLCDLSGRDDRSDVQRPAGRRPCRAASGGQRLLCQAIGHDPAGKTERRSTA